MEKESVFIVSLCVCLAPPALHDISHTLVASVTNLNEPPRALAASTIAWVRS